MECLVDCVVSAWSALPCCMMGQRHRRVRPLLTEHNDSYVKPQEYEAEAVIWMRSTQHAGDR